MNKMINAEGAKEDKKEEVKGAKEEGGSDAKLYSLYMGDRLKDEKSTVIITKMKNFVSNVFKKELTREQQSELVQKCLSALSIQLKEIWKIEDENEMLAAEDALEGTLMKQLYKEVYCSRTDEKEGEFLFYKHLHVISAFLLPSHLGLSEESVSKYTASYLSSKLNELHSYRTPRDKLIVLRNFINVVSNTSKEAISSPSDQSSMDKLFPLLIYYLVKAKPLLLKSTVRYISLFRNHERLKTAEGHSLTHITSAIDFIEKISAEKLEIKKEEFESAYILHEKIEQAKLDEQIMFWRYGSTFCANAEKQKEIETKEKIKEVKAILGKTKSLVDQNFDKLTIAQLKQIVEAQAAITKKLYQEI